MQTFAQIITSGSQPVSGIMHKEKISNGDIASMHPATDPVSLGYTSAIQPEHPVFCINRVLC